MKLLIQRVARASVEVDGMVENRIGTGVVVFVAVRPGDTVEKAQRLASKVLKLQLWSELGNLDSKWCTNVEENGFEVMAIMQQSLLAGLQKLSPSEDSAMASDKAGVIFDAFVKKLQEEYQEEMVVGAQISEEMRVDLTVDCPGIFELDLDQQAAVTQMKKAAALIDEKASNGQLEPSVAAVTKALQRIPLLPKSKAIPETNKVFRVFGLKKFRSAMSEASLAETDAFAEALEGASHQFTEQQQKQIMAWTGLTLTAPPREAAAEQEEPEDQPARPAKVTKVKAELFEEAKGAARMRPDWMGRAAPTTPGTAGRPGGLAGGRGVGAWAGKGMKGKGRGVRSYGIASIDESARLHGTGAPEAHYGQLARYTDQKFYFAKEESMEGAAQRGAKRPVAMLAKGTPTVAPMTPAPASIQDEL